MPSIRAGISLKRRIEHKICGFGHEWVRFPLRPLYETKDNWKSADLQNHATVVRFHPFVLNTQLIEVASIVLTKADVLSPSLA